MPTFRAVTRYKKIDGKATIFIRVIHNSWIKGNPKVGYISTPYSIQPKFMLRDGKVSDRYFDHLELNRTLQGIVQDYEGISIRLGKALRKMPLKEFLARLKNMETNIDFYKYAEQRIEKLKQEGRLSRAENISSVVTRMKQVKETLTFDEITYQFLGNFADKLLAEGINVNSVKQYINNIRAIYNHALDSGVITSIGPFRKFKLKGQPSIKKALDVEDLKKIWTADLSESQRRNIDLFFLSLFLAGINFKDLLFLTYDNLHKGRIKYLRGKTKQELNIKIFPEAQKIFDRYKGKKYLLKFLDDNDAYMHYRQFLNSTDKQLRSVGKTIGVPRLGTYYARHSFATIASKLAPIEIVSQAMGHVYGSKTTNFYIKWEPVDELIRKVIKRIVP